MRCPHCGNINRDEDMYCGQCGGMLSLAENTENYDTSFEDTRASDLPAEATKKIGPVTDPDQDPPSGPASPYARPAEKVPAGDEQGTAQHSPYLAPPRPSYGSGSSSSKPRRMSGEGSGQRPEQPDRSQTAQRRRPDAAAGDAGRRPGPPRKDSRVLWASLAALGILLIIIGVLFLRRNNAGNQLILEPTTGTSAMAAVPITEMTEAGNSVIPGETQAETAPATELIIRYVSGTPAPEPETEETSETVTETAETTTETPVETTAEITTEAETTVTTTEEVTETEAATTEAVTETAAETTAEETTAQAETTEAATEPAAAGPVLTQNPDLTVPEDAVRIARDSEEAVRIDRILNDTFGFGTPGSGQQFRRVEIRDILRDPTEGNRLYVEYYIFEYVPNSVTGSGATVPFYKIYSNSVLVGVAAISADMGSIRNAYNLPPAQRVYLNQLAETDIFLSEIVLEGDRLVSAGSRLQPGNAETLARLNRLDAATGQRVVTVAGDGPAPLYVSRAADSEQIGTLDPGRQVAALPFGNDEWMFIVDSDQGLVGYAQRGQVE